MDHWLRRKDSPVHQLYPFIEREVVDRFQGWNSHRETIHCSISTGRKGGCPRIARLGEASYVRVIVYPTRDNKAHPALQNSLQEPHEMIPFLLSIAFTLLPPVPLGATMAVSGTIAPPSTATKETQLPITGWATYYSSGVFAKVVATRERWGSYAGDCPECLSKDQCPECIGYVAMLWPGDLKRQVCLDVDGFPFGPFLVADNAANHHRQALIDDGWAIDLDYPIWKELGFWNGPTEVIVIECG